jgi:hypothetical protein
MKNGWTADSCRLPEREINPHIKRASQARSPHHSSFFIPNSVAFPAPVFPSFFGGAETKK